MSLVDITAQYVDTNKPINSVGEPRASTDARLWLKQNLHSDPTYLLEATDGVGNRLDVSITVSPAIASSDQEHVRNHSSLVRLRL